MVICNVRGGGEGACVWRTVAACMEMSLDWGGLYHGEER